MLSLLMDIFLPISRIFIYWSAWIVEEVAGILEYDRIRDIETEMGVDFGADKDAMVEALPNLRRMYPDHKMGSVEFSKN